ncbi:unnamed protein product [Leuciscus chuanchicus]
MAPADVRVWNSCGQKPLESALLARLPANICCTPDCSLHRKKRHRKRGKRGGVLARLKKSTGVFQGTLLFTMFSRSIQNQRSIVEQCARGFMESPCPSTPGLDTSVSTLEVGETDESYQLESTLTKSSSTSEDEYVKEDWIGKKIIVNESSLMSLFKFCQMCGKPISSKTIYDTGAQRRVKWMCLGGHSGTWKSSADVRGMPEVNVLSAAAVLFRGGTYTELSDWCQTMCVQMISSSTFYNIQKAFLHPAIEHVYTEQRSALLARVYLEQMDGKRPHLSSDGRCDSPGFNAKYCHYTFMLDSTKEILHTELVQCTEATSSGAMEPLGFRMGMNDLLDMGLDVAVMATDRSTSIQKIMREEFPNVQHEFDIWHTAKGFRKKLLMKGKKKGNEILLSWNRSVVNHMWFSCATSKGDIEALLNRWKIIPHHVVNEHRWTDTDGKWHHCDHAPLTVEEQKKRMWLKKDSVAYQDLTSLVYDKRLLKDLQKMALFKHTGPLEIFHSALLKYLPKRQAFSYEGMRERAYLAIMEHNEKPPRQQENHASSRSSAKSQSNG